MARPEIVAIDVFCGVAGLSLGLRLSGITVVAGIDLDPACRFPFEENIGATFIEADVSTISADDVEQLFGAAQVRLLAGCAPCQPFSGYTTRRREVDKRWQLLLDFLRIVETVRPELVTMENVPRLAHLPLWGEFVTRLTANGYNVDWDVVDAAKYGVPQSLNRLVLLASRLGPIHLPPPSDQPSATVRSAIGSQLALGAGQKNAVDPLHSSRVLTQPNLERIRASKPGGTWRDWPEEMRVNCHRSEKGRTYPSVYGRMSWDRPPPSSMDSATVGLDTLIRIGPSLFARGLSSNHFRKTSNSLKADGGSTSERWAG